MKRSLTWTEKSWKKKTESLMSSMNWSLQMPSSMNWSLTTLSLKSFESSRTKMRESKKTMKMNLVCTGTLFLFFVPSLHQHSLSCLTIRKNSKSLMIKKRMMKTSWMTKKSWKTMMNCKNWSLIKKMSLKSWSLTGSMMSWKNLGTIKKKTSWMNYWMTGNWTRTSLSFESLMRKNSMKSFGSLSWMNWN